MFAVFCRDVKYACSFSYTTCDVVFDVFNVIIVNLSYFVDTCRLERRIIRKKYEFIIRTETNKYKHNNEWQKYVSILYSITYEYL